MATSITNIMAVVMKRSVTHDDNINDDNINDSWPVKYDSMTHDSINDS